MKSFVAIMLLSCMAMATGDTVYKFHDRVKIAQGFFEGCHGVVEEKRRDDSYDVHLKTDREGKEMNQTENFGPDDLMMDLDRDQPENPFKK